MADETPNPRLVVLEESLARATGKLEAARARVTQLEEQVADIEASIAAETSPPSEPPSEPPPSEP
jgi:hypothetical protein